MTTDNEAPWWEAGFEEFVIPRSGNTLDGSYNQLKFFVRTLLEDQAALHRKELEDIAVIIESGSLKVEVLGLPEEYVAEAQEAIRSIATQMRERYAAIVRARIGKQD